MSRSSGQRMCDDTCDNCIYIGEEKKMKKIDKTMKWYYITMGVTFGLICACMFCGIYGKIASGIILITWTLNGFLLGMNFESNKRRDEINELFSIVETQHEMIEQLSQKNKDNMEKEEKTIE